MLKKIASSYKIYIIVIKHSLTIYNTDNLQCITPKKVLHAKRKKKKVIWEIWQKVQVINWVESNNCCWREFCCFNAQLCYSCQHLFIYQYPS